MNEQYLNEIGPLDKNHKLTDIDTIFQKFYTSIP